MAVLGAEEEERPQGEVVRGAEGGERLQQLLNHVLELAVLGGEVVVPGAEDEEKLQPLLNHVLELDAHVEEVDALGADDEEKLLEVVVLGAEDAEHQAQPKLPVLEPDVLVDDEDLEDVHGAEDAEQLLRQHQNQ